MTTNPPKTMVKKTPRVVPAREFLQIARDFTRPLDAIREAISNAMDFHATQIDIKVDVDKKMPGGELVVDICDNGWGMNEHGLESFFNLGDSTHLKEDGTKSGDSIGEKGHGTKTYFNSRQIEVFTRARTGERFYALMDEPLKQLLHGELPDYEVDFNPKEELPQGTRVIIRGFNQNVVYDFSHRILRDHISWLTKFADFSWLFESAKPKTLAESSAHKTGSKLRLHGLGCDTEWENVDFGRYFPAECTSLSEMKKKSATEPMRWYVKRWLKRGLPVDDFPHVKLDIVFSLEGDLVRREYNPMISYQGKKLEGDYTIEQRYGLWAAKDYIPITQVNDWFSRGRSEWTKFHAFVNCQDFSLTANRSDINNTDPKLLSAIEATVQKYYENVIEKSKEFAEYQESVKQEEGYKSKQQESDDLKKRKARASKKHAATFAGVELLAPGTSVKGARGQEIGVHCLFSQLVSLKPDLFPFKVVDYDSHRGYDCLVSHSTALDLSNPSLAFVEFKYMLDTTFNHSFDNLAYVVCWDCDLNHGTEIRDLTGEPRILEVYPTGDGRDHTTYYLRGIGKPHNIEVFVLKKYCADKLAISFAPKLAPSG